MRSGSDYQHTYFFNSSDVIQGQHDVRIVCSVEFSVWQHRKRRFRRFCASRQVERLEEAPRDHGRDWTVAIQLLFSPVPETWPIAIWSLDRSSLSQQQTSRASFTTLSSLLPKHCGRKIRDASQSITFTVDLCVRNEVTPSATGALIPIWCSSAHPS